MLFALINVSVSGIWGISVGIQYTLPHNLSHWLVFDWKLHWKTKTSTSWHHLHATCFVSSFIHSRVNCMTIHSQNFRLESLIIVGLETSSSSFYVFLINWILVLIGGYHVMKDFVTFLFFKFCLNWQRGLFFFFGRGWMEIVWMMRIIMIYKISRWGEK